MGKKNSSTDLSQFDAFAAQEGFQAVFNSNYAAAYCIFTQKLLDAVHSIDEPLAVLDLGCGDGWTAEIIAVLKSGRYAGIDPSGISLEKLGSRLIAHPNFQTKGFQQSGEWLLSAEAADEIVRFLGKPPNLFICNATFHQLRKAFPDVGSVVEAAIRILADGAKVVIGDYHYPVDLSDTEVEAAREWVRVNTGQNPTVREGLFHPDPVRRWIEKSGVEIMGEEHVRATSHIPVIYYVFWGEVRSK